jgi:hypothetical protein
MDHEAYKEAHNAFAKAESQAKGSSVDGGLALRCTICYRAFKSRAKTLLEKGEFESMWTERIPLSEEKAKLLTKIFDNVKGIRHKQKKNVLVESKYLPRMISGQELKGVMQLLSSRTGSGRTKPDMILRSSRRIFKVLNKLDNLLPIRTMCYGYVSCLNTSITEFEKDYNEFLSLKGEIPLERVRQLGKKLVALREMLRSASEDMYGRDSNYYTVHNDKVLPLLNNIDAFMVDLGQQMHVPKDWESDRTRDLVLKDVHTPVKDLDLPLKPLTPIPSALSAQVLTSELIEKAFPSPRGGGLSDLQGILNSLSLMKNIFHHFREGSAYKGFSIMDGGLARAIEAIEALRNCKEPLISVGAIKELARQLNSHLKISQHFALYAYERNKHSSQTLLISPSQLLAGEFYAATQYSGDPDAHKPRRLTILDCKESFLDSYFKKIENRINRLGECAGLPVGWQEEQEKEPQMQKDIKAVNPNASAGAA